MDAWRAPYMSMPARARLCMRDGYIATYKQAQLAIHMAM